MSEKNTSLIYAIVKHLGARTAVDTWYRVREIQAQGGMMLEKKRPGANTANTTDTTTTTTTAVVTSTPPSTSASTSTSTSSIGMPGFGQPPLRPTLKPYQPPRPAEFMMDTTTTADTTSSSPSVVDTTTDIHATPTVEASSSPSPSRSPSPSASPSPSSDMPDESVAAPVETTTISDTPITDESSTLLTSTETVTTTPTTDASTATSSSTHPQQQQQRGRSSKARRAAAARASVIRPRRGARTDGGIFIKLIRDDITEEKWAVIQQHHKHHLQLIKANIAIKDVVMEEGTEDKENTTQQQQQQHHDNTTRDEKITTAFSFAPPDGVNTITTTPASAVDLPVVATSPLSSSFSLAPGLASFTTASSILSATAMT